MRELRPYTGTQQLQLLWTIAVFVVLVLALTGRSVFEWVPGVPVLLSVGGLGWVAGLVGLGYRERRRWNTMVERSSFDRRPGAQAADLETFVDGRSVTATTTMSGLFGRTHTEITTAVEGVDATFTVRLRYAGASSEASRPPTESEAIGDHFVVEGASENALGLFDEPSALLDVETSGVCTITGEDVTYEVPFSSLSARELNALATVVVAVARRVEHVGR